MRVFVSELSRCLKVKTIYKTLFWLTFVSGLLGLFGLWIYTLLQPVKTEKDFVREYVECRLNFTPDTARKAYYCPLQYQDPYYDARIKPILDYIEEKGIYQLFILKKLEKKGKFWLADGRLVRFGCKSQSQDCLKLIDTEKAVKVYKIKGKFAVEEEF